MVYFMHYTNRDIIYRLDRKTNLVHWVYFSKAKSVQYSHDEIQENFSDGSWIKCTKKGIPLEVKK